MMTMMMMSIIKTERPVASHALFRNYWRRDSLAARWQIKDLYRALCEEQWLLEMIRSVGSS